MRSVFLIFIFSVFLLNFCAAQAVSDPKAAKFITQDITNFWNAFDKLDSTNQANPFDEYYIKKGSAGLLAFMRGRIENAGALLNTVREQKAKYVKSRDSSLKILKKEKQCRAVFMALKYLYPDAIYPPVYFVIGRFNSGGYSNPKGLIIGAEMTQPESVPFTVAHELIHYQQDSISKEKLNLLAACINEGSADFLAELISGRRPNEQTYNYGDAHEEELWNEFKKIKNDRENSHEWMYNYQPRNGYPPDLGYWIGYKITKAYYQKSKNKKKAISDILHIKDFEKFLRDSHYELQFK